MADRSLRKRLPNQHYLNAGRIAMIIVLYAAGVVLLLAAAWFASVETAKAYVTPRTVTDFSGDVVTWLRSESE